MNKSKYSIIISTCNKYKQLWAESIKHIKKHWIGQLPNIFLVTDRPSETIFDDVTILSFEDPMPLRIKKAIEIIGTEYYLITFDDYFVTEDVHGSDIEYLADYCNIHHCSYVQLYDRKKKKKKNKTIDDVKIIDTSKPYSVCLYPAIWEKEFALACFSNELSPWELEPKLSSIASTNNIKCCYAEKECFQILDVIRKGKVLHKAKKYCVKNKIDIGEWQTVSYFEEFKLYIVDRIAWHFPKTVVLFLKKIARFFGHSFYSDHV